MMWKQIDNDILSAELPVLFPGEKIIPPYPFSLCLIWKSIPSGIWKNSSWLSHISWEYSKSSSIYPLPLQDTQKETART